MQFREFPKIPRLFREVIFTEKLDGTNACVIVTEDGQVGAQSRTRLITPGDDNYGFSYWVEQHADELRELGPGHHFGEWWGRGINRGYGLSERRFSLFNVSRWADARPACCEVVPVISRGTALDSFEAARDACQKLRRDGSYAAPGFTNPEGIVAFHTHGNVMFKVTLERDEAPKGKRAA